MEWARKGFNANGTSYVIRLAEEQDAEELSLLRLQADGETENLDREIRGRLHRWVHLRSFDCIGR